MAAEAKVNRMQVRINQGAGAKDKIETSDASLKAKLTGLVGTGVGGTVGFGVGCRRGLSQKA